MAFRTERVYLSHSSPNKTEIKNVIEKIKEVYLGEVEARFRIEWGGEYLDLRITEDNIIIPDRGSRSIFSSSVFFTTYEPETLVKILKNATRFSVFEGPKQVDLTSFTFFDTIKILRYKDYPRMICDLEKAGKVIVTTSNNLLSVSGKVFRFLNHSKYGVIYYEVDSIGTSIFKDLTEDIEKMWKEI